MYKQFNLQDIVEQIITLDGILSKYVNPEPEGYSIMSRVIPLSELPREVDIDPKEFGVQKALGTLPMKKFTMALPIKLDISIDLMVEAEAGDAQAALKEFSVRINDSTTLLELVRKTLNDMTNSYRSEENLTIPRAVAHARKELNFNEALVVKVKVKDE